MKRKLFRGLGIVLVILAIGAAVVVHNLQTILLNQQLINEQDVIIAKYNDMLFHLKGAQAELYRHQAGYSRNIDDLVNNIEDFETNMVDLAGQYSGHRNDVACMQCHPRIEERLASISGIFGELQALTKAYKGDVSILLTTDDASQIRPLEDAATKTGTAVTVLLEKARHGSDKMRAGIKKNRNLLINRSRDTIIATILLTGALAFIVILVVVRSVTVPVTDLIRGIETIGQGDYTRRVEVGSNDEIGFLANSYNDMAARLTAMNTEKDRLLEELKVLNESLESRVHDATEKLKTAQDNMVRAETLAAVGTLAAGVSHEISTPLNSIIGFTQIGLSELEDTHPLKADLRIIEQEALRCKRIVQGLLDFSRASAPATHEVQVNTVLAETLALIEYQPAMRKIEVKRFLADDLPIIEADPMQLRQVFLNLILNAVQAMPGGGNLRVETRSFGGCVEAIIGDTGTGIAEADVQKIFQPFFTTKSGGTGLGLSISYGIVKEHHGEILVESTVGAGASFRVVLPLQPPRAGGKDMPMQIPVQEENGQ